MTTLIADCETNGLLPEMTKLHMVQIGDADGDDAVIYADLPEEQLRGVLDRGVLKSPIRPLAEGLERLRSAERVVFHNGIGFDYDAINHFYPGTLRLEQVLDTLVMARLAKPEEKSHTLRDWGIRVGVHKDDYKGDYQTVDDEFLAYSEQDVVVGRALWHKVKHVLDWGMSCALEHEVARALVLQERNGFCFAATEGEMLATELREQLETVTRNLTLSFPPLEKVVKSIVPKRDNAKLGYTQGVLHETRAMLPFNPASRAQCVERLMMAGWKPNITTPAGDWKLDEKILEELPYPEAKALVEFYSLGKKLAQLDGKKGWCKLVQRDGRIHGRVNPNGCVTGRMSHWNPNTANVDKDARLRALWRPRAGWKLIGCDAAGLEARMLAHYLHPFDKGAYVAQELEGNSKDRTDSHSATLKASIKIGLVPKIAWSDDTAPGHEESYYKVSRGRTKNLRYALMYGGQDPKLGAMVKLLYADIGIRPPTMPDKERGALFRKALMVSMVGLETLTNKVKAAAAAKKHLVGLDGRKLPVRAQHAALNTLLQGGGAIVMKLALCIWLREAAAKGWVHGLDYGLCGNIHDEWQVEARPEIADELAAMMEGAIRQAGVNLKLRCPLAGEATVGANWSETH